MPHPKVKIADNSGNEVAVTSNALDVNIAGGTADIDIGDVSLLLGGTAASTNAGANDAQTLRITMAVDDTLTQTMLNLSKLEDAEHSSGDRGIMALAVRNDTLLSLVGHDGDYTPLQVDASGSLYVNVDESLINPGLAYAGHKGMGALGLRNDVLDAVALVDDGEYTVFQMNAKGALYVTGGEVENAAVQSEPMLMGGRYDSSARTLGNGDAGAVALNPSGHVLIDVVDGGQLDALLDTIKVDTEAIETAVELLDNAIDGSEMQVDIVSSTTLSVNAHAVTNAGTFVVQEDGAALTALQLIDDVVYTDDSTEFTLGSSKGVMMMGFAGTQSVNTDDVAALRCGTTGHLYTRLESVDSSANASAPYVSDASSYLATKSGPSIKAVCSDTLAALTSVGDGEWTSLQVDTQGALYTTHGITGMVSDRNVAISNSTAEQLNAATDGSYDQACKRVDLQAALDNTGYILVGDSGILANLSGGGIKLNAGDFYSMDVNNVGDIYVLAETDGEDIYYTYYT